MSVGRETPAAVGARRLAASTTQPAARPRGINGEGSLDFSLEPAADTEAVGDTVDIVEPTCDQVDLQNAPVVEADASQFIEIRWRHLPGMSRQLGSIVEHGPIGFGQ